MGDLVGAFQEHCWQARSVTRQVYQLPHPPRRTKNVPEWVRTTNLRLRSRIN
ncbi:hypothetical protein Plim_1033 [Planctopirus limnophila DSM 3776]|uniref:Uncharacterized protein n=1 Tax=Planctopirus limnophila (strain ATCC 43296 / DSM 3776 / IFAM 1008 / Mu 290) TaxID=521674 RepID=D5STA8_PLAL2|nr:hypothetical protein Plim_1033 [Planctopirus limnophila DSM 3776]